MLYQYLQIYVFYTPIYILFRFNDIYIIMYNIKLTTETHSNYILFLFFSGQLYDILESYAVPFYIGGGICMAASICIEDFECDIQKKLKCTVEA